MKQLFILKFVLLFLLSFGSKASAQGYYVYLGINQGVYYSWGWFPYTYFYGPNYYPYGYSYWSYYNYQPYYASYGALAYSVKENRVGWSWGKASSSMALRTAEIGCGAEDCQGMIWVQGGCASIAKGVIKDDQDNQVEERLYYGLDLNRARAESQALTACTQDDKTDCQIGAWTCSF